jgi:hypothetical protein
MLKIIMTCKICEFSQIQNMSMHYILSSNITYLKA